MPAAVVAKVPAQGIEPVMMHVLEVLKEVGRLHDSRLEREKRPPELAVVRTPLPRRLLERGEELVIVKASFVGDVDLSESEMLALMSGLRSTPGFRRLVVRF